MCSSPRWFSALVRAGALVSSPVSSEKRRIRATMPSRRPSVVRVERIFSSSALICAITASAPSSARGRSPRARSRRRRARGPGRRPRTRSRRRCSVLVPWTISTCSLLGLVSICSRLSAACSCAGSGVRTRTEPPTRAVSCSSEDSITSRPWLMISTWSTVCATSASTWLEMSTVRPPRRTRAGSHAASGHPRGRARSRARRGRAARALRAGRRRARAAGACRASSP